MSVLVQIAPIINTIRFRLRSQGLIISDSDINQRVGAKIFMFGVIEQISSSKRFLKVRAGKWLCLRHLLIPVL